VRIFTFLNEPSELNEWIPDGSIARSIVANFATSCLIPPPDIGQHRADDADATRALIPKLLADGGNADRPLTEFLESWESHPILSIRERRALNVILEAARTQPMTVREIVGFFPTIETR
jgi:hypothetical protein